MSGMHRLLQNTDPNLQPWRMELQQNAFSWGRSTAANKGLSHSQAMLSSGGVQKIRSTVCSLAAGLSSSMSCTQCLSLACTPGVAQCGADGELPPGFAFGCRWQSRAWSRLPAGRWGCPLGSQCGFSRCSYLPCCTEQGSCSHLWLNGTVRHVGHL